MKGYLMSILGASLMAGVVECALPEGGGFKKAMRTLTSLLLLCVILSPARGTVPSWDDLWGRLEGLAREEDEWYESYEAIQKEGLLAMGEKHVEQGLTTLLGERFGIDAKNLGVSVVCEGQGESIRVVQVEVELYGAAIFCDPHAIEVTVGDLLDCECRVFVGRGG